MSRLASCFAALKSEGRSALIPFVTAGDPSADVTVPLMHAMVEAGASVIELGVPFSDPMADGPVIQRANERALSRSMSLKGVLKIVAEFRNTNSDTPVVLMGYLNPIEAAGYEAFAKAAATAGVDGLIIVDLPPEEATDLLTHLKLCGIDLIFLLSPTTSEARIKRICEHASGFIYYVSLKGVTGSATLDTDAVAARVGQIKALTPLPVGVGFGISDGESAARVARVSDAVVVGSVLVREVESLQETPEQIPAKVSSLLKVMREAMDATA